MLLNLAVFAIAKGRGLEQVGLRCQVFFGFFLLLFCKVISEVFNFWWSCEVEGGVS